MRVHMRVERCEMQRFHENSKIPKMFSFTPMSPQRQHKRDKFKLRSLILAGFAGPLILLCTSDTDVHFLALIASWYTYCGCYTTGAGREGGGIGERSGSTFHLILVDHV